MKKRRSSMCRSSQIKAGGEGAAGAAVPGYRCWRRFWSSPLKRRETSIAVPMANVVDQDGRVRGTVH
jgi:hypothetical protein